MLDSEILIECVSFSFITQPFSGWMTTRFIVAHFWFGYWVRINILVRISSKICWQCSILCYHIYSGIRNNWIIYLSKKKLRGFKIDSVDFNLLIIRTNFTVKVCVCIEPSESQTWTYCPVRDRIRFRNGPLPVLEGSNGSGRMSHQAIHRTP